jgi:hypothetical protein
MIRFLIGLLASVAFVYLAVTAAIGYRFGQEIYKSKTKSVFVEIGSNAIGRDGTERVALQAAKFSPIITNSPAFWLGLRATGE